VVESSLAISQNEGVTIRGRGVLFTPHGEGKKPGVVPLKIDTSKNVRVEGIIVVSRADQWSIHVTKSRNVTFENFHLLSEIRDGLDILNSQEVFVRDSLIMAHDDALCLKGMWFGGGQPVEHIRVERCVLANMGGGNGIELGFEANAPVFRDVTFQDSDILYSLPNGEKPDPAWPEGALTIHNHNTHGGVAASVRDVLYEDLRIEELQDDYLIDLHPLGGSTNSVIEGVTFRNIRQVGGKQRPSRIAGRADFPVRNVRVEKLQLFDKSVRTADEGKIAVNPHASNILFSVAQ
jgi:polygalacturonase